VKNKTIHINELKNTKNIKNTQYHPSPLHILAVLFTTTGLHVGMRIIPINKLSGTRFWPVINGIRHPAKRDRLN